MLTLCSARAWQSLPSVPGRSSKRIVNSLLVGMVGTSLRCTSGMGWKGHVRSNDAWNPTPAMQTHSRLLLDGTNGLLSPIGEVTFYFTSGNPTYQALGLFPSCPSSVTWSLRP